jgi:hypothetical protein
MLLEITLPLVGTFVVPAIITVLPVALLMLTLVVVGMVADNKK